MRHLLRISYSEGEQHVIEETLALQVQPWSRTRPLAAARGSQQSSDGAAASGPPAQSSGSGSSGSGDVNPITGTANELPAEGLELADQQQVLSAAAQVAATALLVSPFFFWGTSMVGMKVGDTATLLAVACRHPKEIAVRPAGQLTQPMQGPNARRAGWPSKPRLEVARCG